MSKTVTDQILERLADWGVSHVFGYPGDGSNGIMGAFNRDDHGCRFIQVRHEEMAAFMACGFAKMTGKVGVCLATSGPGAIHLRQDGPRSRRRHRGHARARAKAEAVNATAPSRAAPASAARCLESHHAKLKPFAWASNSPRAP